MTSEAGYHFHYTAGPLDDEELGELIEEGLGDLIFLLDGRPYNEEDLYACDGCELRFTDRSELDDDLLCEDCAREAREEYEYQQCLIRWYHGAVL